MQPVSLVGIRSKMMTLAPSERAELAADLLASLDGKSDRGSRAAWDDELVARIAAVRQGTAKTLDLHEFMDKIASELAPK